MGKPWFRFYSETLRDKKIELICNATGQSKATIIGIWAILLSLANDSPERGVMIVTEGVPLALDDIIGDFGTDYDVGKSIIEQFIRFNMFALTDKGYEVLNWPKRQFASDDSKERVRRFREKKKTQEQECNGSENVTSTLQGSDGNLPDTDTDTEADTDAEQRQKKNMDTPSAAPSVPTTIDSWKLLIKDAPNKPAELRKMIEHFFPTNILPTYSRIGGFAKTIGGYGRLAKEVWKHSADAIDGDVLAYIQTCLNNEKPEKKDDSKDGPGPAMRVEDLPPEAFGPAPGAITTQVGDKKFIGDEEVI